MATLWKIKLKINKFCYFFSHQGSTRAIFRLQQTDYTILIAAHIAIVNNWLCLSVCHKHWFFFFVSRWNRAISWPSVLRDKNLFFDFGFRPPNTQNLFTPQNLHKIACGSLSQSWSVNGHWVSHSLWVMDCGSTKFGLGAEIQSPSSPTGMSVWLSHSFKFLLLFFVSR